MRSVRGYTLLEMLTTVAALIIVLGLMVSLARYVRNASAIEVTKRLLRDMEGLLAQYRAQHADALPLVTPFVGAHVDADEAGLQRAALANNQRIVAVLRSATGVSPDLFGGLPDSIYNDATLRDPWGSPIVYMPAMHPMIGMAPDNRPFFFSAGPDRQYLTQDDNLYSYEERVQGSGFGVQPRKANDER